MTKIITIIIRILNTINKLSWRFIIFLSKFIKKEELDNINSKPDDVRYRHFKVDEAAIIQPFKELEKLDYKFLIKQHCIKPIKRRNGKEINLDVSCPRCNAPKEYLYDNSNGIQFECKCCSHLFSINPVPLKDFIHKCPHCHHQLDLYHKRADFNVYRCKNDIVHIISPILTL